jgi:thiamine biosynthesis lipoprotein
MRFGEPAAHLDRREVAWRWSVAIGAVLLALGAVRAETISQVQRQRYSMGTIFSIVVYHGSPAEAERAVDAAMGEIVRLDAVMSRYKEQSDLTRLNRDGRRGFVAVAPSLYEVVEQSLDVSRRSGGRFDVTIAPLLRVWRDAYEAGRQPSVEEVAGARRCAGYQHVELKRPNLIRFRSDCLELDLGGIGKGYAVDRALEVLQSAGIRHAAVNAGGSTIGAIGSPPGSDGWPVDLGARVAGRSTLWLRDGAISTSQQRLRRLPFTPGEFGEIIDPGRGAPAPHETIVSVITPSATRADALSTTLLLLPVEDGKTLLAQFSPASALWMSPTGELQDSFRPSGLRLSNAE